MFFLVDTLYSYIDSYIAGLSYSSSLNRILSKNSDNYSKEYNNSNLPAKKVPLINHYDIIYKRDIFKTAKDIDADNKNGEASLSEKELELLEKTELKLKLWGTATGGDDSENYAVIETDKDKKQELYKKGDKIEDAVIKKILRLSVILSRNGKDEKLEITEETNTSKNSSNLQSNSSINSSSLTASENSENISIKRTLIEESMKDINALMNQVRVKPHFTGGNADGILLYGIKQNSMFKEMGIQNGDIIMGIDGKEITSVEDAISLYDRLKNSSDLKMQIRRRGQVKELSYHVE